ncbi:MAG TPA: hypothetical protein VGB07_37260 [Blastocatellia bacterium]
MLNGESQNFSTMAWAKTRAIFLSLANRDAVEDPPFAIDHYPLFDRKRKPVSSPQ